tara:strand:- start:900 stop:1637 length:738 start_codon:yes stop_codon:yes gene_type:complete
MFRQIRIAIYQYLFFSLVFFALVEGWYCKYSSQRSNVEGSFCEKYFLNFWNENGFIETIQVILILISLILSFNFFFKSKIKIEKKMFFIISIGLFYYFGEEISWGQHYIKFNTPAVLVDINNQKEFNLHNISNLFDQLPRSLVFIICSFSFILILINERIFHFKLKYNYLILPSKNLAYTSVLLLFISLPDFINNKFDLQLYNYLENYLYELFTFNYIRLSELQELIFSFYFLNYMLEIKKKIQT